MKIKKKLENYIWGKNRYKIEQFNFIHDLIVSEITNLKSIDKSINRAILTCMNLVAQKVLFLLAFYKKTVK